jgi:hypothetical protein
MPGWGLLLAVLLLLGAYGWMVVPLEERVLDLEHAIRLHRQLVQAGTRDRADEMLWSQVPARKLRQPGQEGEP